MDRRWKLLIVVAAVLAFLAVSFALARVYGSVSSERAALSDLVRAEARGDQRAMLADLYRCGPDVACRSRVAANATTLRRAGKVTVLQILPSTSFPLGGNVGTARIAWAAGGSSADGPASGAAALPVTQCVRVRHAGNPVTGLRVELLWISARIKTSADCPKRY